MAKAAAAASPPKGGSILGLIVSILVLTVVAAAGGVLVGKQIVAAAAQTAEAPGAKAGAAGKNAVTTAVRELPPIITNLSAPEGAWIRLQTAIVYDKTDDKQIDLTASQIVDDTMAYIKTLTVTDLQGASGLQHLREDLNERATLRSDGRVHEVIIEAMVIE